MMEYFDFGTNLQTLVNTLYEEEDTAHSSESPDHIHDGSCRRKVPIDKSFYQVRQSVCVAGVNGNAIRDVKSKIAGLLDQPVALESFHVRSAEDVKDGAMLVPKVVLVASHCPGKKVLDDEEDEGQLDKLYDEACEVGADIMLVYMGLPHSIYPPMTHIIYHPKMEEMVFPCQPLLRHLASENCFLTISDGCDLNALQKNVLKEWLVRPVDKNHPVYSAADHMCSGDAGRPVSEYSQKTAPPTTDLSEPTVDYQPATEEHPLAEKKKKKKRKFGFKSLKRRSDARPGMAKPQEGLAPVQEGHEDDLEMDMYRGSTTAISMEVGSTAVF